MDKFKLDHARQRTKENAHQKHIDKTEKKIICIGVEERHDKDTLLYKMIIGADGKKIKTFTKEIIGADGPPTQKKN